MNFCYYCPFQNNGKGKLKTVQTESFRWLRLTLSCVGWKVYSILADKSFPNASSLFALSLSFSLILCLHKDAFQLQAPCHESVTAVSLSLPVSGALTLSCLIMHSCAVCLFNVQCLLDVLNTIHQHTLILGVNNGVGAQSTGRHPQY